MSAPLRPSDPRSIGRYRILARLGEGGMGSVYLGRDPDGRLVAVKVIRPEYAHEEEFRARFRSEVSRAREVPPFCTAEVLDADPDHVTPYLVVEYVDGPSLNEVVVDNGPLAGGSLHGVAVGVAAALAAIHGVGVIHRDLKPRNVLFALGTPKVIDFGIARPLEPTSFHTRPQEMVGTLAYMAPERLDPETDRLLTPAVDVFAWGAVVVYAGTGRTPFGGDSPAVTAARILTQPPRVRGLPPYLAELVEAALEKDPDNRPSAGDLLDRLLVTGTPSAPGPATLPPELRREAEAAQQSARYRTGGHRKQRGGWGRRVAAITAAVAVVATGVGLLSRKEEPPAPLPAAAPVIGPSIFDPLQRVGEFQLYADDSGECRFEDGLSVTTRRNTFTRCGPTPTDVFPAAQTIGVQAKLGTADSCAGIWFRLVGDLEVPSGGYQVAVCPTEVTLYRNVEGTDPVATAKRVTATGTVHRIQLVADDRQVTVSVDGAPALQSQLTEAGLVSGRVSLGAVARSGGRGVVTLTDAQLRSGTSLDVPAVPAFTTGDAEFTAAMWFLYDLGGVATVEPTEYLTGAAYCRRFGLAATAPDCQRKIVPVAGPVRVTLPTDPDYLHLDYQDGKKKCQDPRNYIGTCQVSRSKFALMGKSSPWPALVTIRGGVITAVAKMDIPES